MLFRSLRRYLRMCSGIDLSVNRSLTSFANKPAIPKGVGLVATLIAPNVLAALFITYKASSNSPADLNGGSMLGIIGPWA